MDAYQAGEYSADNNASNAQVTIKQGGSDKNIYGGYSDAGDANNNSVTMTGGKGNFIFGGYSNSEAVTGNMVTMTNGKVTVAVYGGLSGSGDATDNIVTMTDGEVGFDIFGGRSTSGAVTGNTVSMSGGTVTGGVFGGLSGSGDATGNTVTMSGDTANYIYGGRSDTGAVEKNTVTMTAGDVGNFILGGYSPSGAVNGNSVTMTGGKVNQFIFGGESDSGAVTGNMVTMIDGDVGGNILGGRSMNGDVTGNTVTMTGGKARSVVGGYSQDRAATNNTVTMTGGKALGLYGGESNSGAVTGNTVSMSGGTVTNTVYGGYSDASGAVTGNTVHYSGGKIEGSLFGGYTAGASADNTLISIGSRKVGTDVGFFQSYQFVLDADQNVGLTVGQTFTMDPTTNNILGVDALGGGTNIKTGDTLTLVSAGSIDDDNGNRVITAGATGTGKKGASLLFDYQVAVNAKTITATITKVRAHPQAKSVLEGRIAGITTINQAGDMLAGKGIAAASAVTESTGFGIYAATSGGTNRYKTGSHVDLDSISFILGAGWRKNTGSGAFLFSPFFEFGWGKYKAHNDFSGFADVNAKGNTNYQGGGLLARYDHCNGLYGEASFRLGRLHQSYNTNDLADVMGRRGAHYKYNQLYTSLHLGIGRKFALGMGELDVYGKYFWTRTGKKDVTIIDDPISFDATHSHRMRLGARYTHAVSEAVKPYAGAGFEYEFAGKAKGKAYRLYDINSPRIKGGSGLLEAGIDYTPCGKKWAINGGVTGYVGKRRGITGQLGIRADF